MALSRFVNGQVCKQCNTGWMSRLEEVVKPTIERLMNLDPSVEAEFPSQQMLLSRWAVKTAAVLNHASNYRPLVPSEHFEAVFRGEMPECLHINVAFTRSEGSLSFRQSQQALIIGDPGVITAAVRKSYRISFQFRHLLLRVVYLPLPSVYLEDETLRLWPTLWAPDEPRIFDNIDDFDLSGVFRSSE